MATREFDISDILSITTGRLLSTRRMEGVYEILNFMCRDNLFTHQLPRAGDECRPILLAKHPQLADADPAGITPENCHEYVARWRDQFGDSLPVDTLQADEHERIDPMSELAEMAHPDRTIAIGV